MTSYSSPATRGEPNPALAQNSFTVLSFLPAPRMSSDKKRKRLCHLSTLIFIFEVLKCFADVHSIGKTLWITFKGPAKVVLSTRPHYRIIFEFSYLKIHMHQGLTLRRGLCNNFESQVVSWINFPAKGKGDWEQQLLGRLRLTCPCSIATCWQGESEDLLTLKALCWDGPWGFSQETRIKAICW